MQNHRVIQTDWHPYVLCVGVESVPNWAKKKIYRFDSIVREVCPVIDTYQLIDNREVGIIIINPTCEFAVEGTSAWGIWQAYKTGNWQTFLDAIGG